MGTGKKTFSCVGKDFHKKHVSDEKYLESLSVFDRMYCLQQFVDNYKLKLMFLTSGGRTSALLPHLYQKVTKKIPEIIWINTGYYPKSTVDMVRKYFIKECGYHVHIYKSLYSPKEIDVQYPNWANNPTSQEFRLVVEKVKLEPFRGAIEQLQPTMLARGVRRYQTVQRSQLKILKRGSGIWLFHPFLPLRREEVDSLMHEAHLPYNHGHIDLTKNGNGGECGIGDICSSS